MRLCRCVPENSRDPCALKGARLRVSCGVTPLSLCNVKFPVITSYTRNIMLLLRFEFRREILRSTWGRGGKNVLPAVMQYDF